MIVEFPHTKPAPKNRLSSPARERTPAMSTDECAARYAKLDDRGKAAISKLIDAIDERKRRKAACTANSREFWAAYAKRLRFARAALDITERDAAEALGITLRTYRRWEKGGLHRDNSLWGEVQFAEKYDLSVAWLVGGTQHGQPPGFKLRVVS
jgi:DNA-binding transcriptional regulator YiaG